MVDVFDSVDAGTATGCDEAEDDRVGVGVEFVSGESRRPLNWGLVVGGDRLSLAWSGNWGGLGSARGGGSSVLFDGRLTFVRGGGSVSQRFSRTSSHHITQDDAAKMLSRPQDFLGSSGRRRTFFGIQQPAHIKATRNIICLR